MLYTPHYIDNMDGVIAALRDGRLIEAIKVFRGFTGLGLRESKHVVEAIRDAMPAGSGPASVSTADEYVLITRDADEGDYNVTTGLDHTDAMQTAKDVCANRQTTLVARVIAKSATVTTTTMQAV